MHAVNRASGYRNRYAKIASGAMNMPILSCVIFGNAEWFKKQASRNAPAVIQNKYTRSHVQIHCHSFRFDF